MEEFNPVKNETWHHPVVMEPQQRHRKRVDNDAQDHAREHDTKEDKRDGISWET